MRVREPTALRPSNALGWVSNWFYWVPLAHQFPTEEEIQCGLLSKRKEWYSLHCSAVYMNTLSLLEDFIR